ncbi:uncharacterized protein ARMOST_21929 [Armillaria ostoyae]|uniref:Uncharacterized protein n=1 Tax=Armillaria ostoyae TaxID=47428 RepID=A0A284SBG5_ARMOS|nr:uncharacterized protein ARMOST_21929 [Armillaria ostoyae]
MTTRLLYPLHTVKSPYRHFLPSSPTGTYLTSMDAIHEISMKEALAMVRPDCVAVEDNFVMDLSLPKSGIGQRRLNSELRNATRLEVIDKILAEALSVPAIEHDDGRTVYHVGLPCGNWYQGGLLWMYQRQM